MKNHVMSLAAPGILAKARRLQLAEASFRDLHVGPHQSRPPQNSMEGNVLSRRQNETIPCLAIDLQKREGLHMSKQTGVWSEVDGQINRQIA